MLFEKKFEVKFENKRKQWSSDSKNTKHKWQCIKEPITRAAEEISLKEKSAPKREWITMEIIQGIERRILLKNKTDEDGNR